MVIPLGGGGMSMPEDEEVPEKIRDSHYIGWYCIFTLFMCGAIGSMVALKIFDCLILLLIGILTYYLIKDNCKNMSQQCLFSYGLVCVIQCVMDCIILGMSLPGRRTQTTTHNGGTVNGASPHAAPSPFAGQSHESSYTVTTKTEPFFSEAAGWHYNLQSAMMIYSVVNFLFAALMARYSYNCYTNSLFDGAGESRPMAGGSSYGSGGGGRYVSGGAPARQNNARAAPASHTATFGGSGQRLGS